MSTAESVAWATLSTQVQGLDADYTELRSEITGLGHKLESAVSGISQKLDSQLAALHTKVEERGRPQWQALGVQLTALAALIGLLYWPVREKAADQHERLAKIEERIVPRTEHLQRWRQIELADDRLMLDVNRLRDTIMPKDQIEILRQSGIERALNLQRQVDEIRRDVGGVVTTRDMLQDMQKKVDRLEMDLRSTMTRQR